MLDLKFVRENPEIVKQNIRNKFQDRKLPLVDEVIELDEQARATQTEADELRANRNKLSKQIGALMAQGKKEEAEEVKAKVNADAEQMTLWEYREGKKNEPGYNQPKRLKPDRQMWRDFSAITVPQSNGKTPGIMNWVVLLKWKEVLENNFIIHFRTVGAKYGDKDFFIEDILEDHLDFHKTMDDYAETKAGAKGFTLRHGRD